MNKDLFVCLAKAIAYSAIAVLPLFFLCWLWCFAL